MKFQPKTDWKYDDTPTEADFNRIEQGIADALEGNDPIIQQETPPDGIKEGRLWLDTSDDTYQGTVFENFKGELAGHLADEAKHLKVGEREKWNKSISNDTILATNNWNNYKSTGFYMGQNLLNAPPNKTGDNNWWYVQVIQHDPKWCVQLAWNLNNSKRAMSRSLVNDVWTKWENAGGGGLAPTVKEFVVESGQTIVKGDAVVVNANGKVEKQGRKSNPYETYKYYAMDEETIHYDSGSALVTVFSSGVTLYVKQNSTNYSFILSRIGSDGKKDRVETDDVLNDEASSSPHFNVCEISEYSFAIVFNGKLNINMRFCIYDINPVTLVVTLRTFVDYPTEGSIFHNMVYLGNDFFIVTSTAFKVRVIKLNANTNTLSVLSTSSPSGLPTGGYSLYVCRLSDKTFALSYEYSGTYIIHATVNENTGVVTYGTTSKIHTSSSSGTGAHTMVALTDRKIVARGNVGSIYGILFDPATNAVTKSVMYESVNYTATEFLRVDNNHFILITPHGGSAVYALKGTLAEFTDSGVVTNKVTDIYYRYNDNIGSGDVGLPRSSYQYIKRLVPIKHGGNESLTNIQMISYPGGSPYVLYQMTYSIDSENKPNGVALGGATVGQTIEIAVKGTVSDLSNLLIGKHYRALSGVLVPTIAQDKNAIGIALSSTELLLL